MTIRALTPMRSLRGSQRMLTGFAAPLTVEQFAGGQSNPTLQAGSRPARSYVMRRKPTAGETAAVGAAIEREYRVIGCAARRPTCPSPRMFALCDRRNA